LAIDKIAAAMNKLIIEVRVNEYAMRDESPYVPWTPAELGSTCRDIENAGISYK